jgi:hypothetical protein
MEPIALIATVGFIFLLFVIASATLETTIVDEQFLQQIGATRYSDTELDINALAYYFYGIGMDKNQTLVIFIPNSAAYSSKDNEAIKKIRCHNLKQLDCHVFISPPYPIPSYCEYDCISLGKFSDKKQLWNLLVALRIKNGQYSI